MRIEGVLFAAGRGERLRPLTDRISKPALPILDVPLGAWGLTALLASAQLVTVNVSHLGHTTTDALTPLAPPGALEILHEPSEPYGTAGTLRELASRLADEVAVWNGDLVADVDVEGARRVHRELGRPATLVVRHVESGADLIVDGDLATGFIDRRVDPKASGFQFVGVAVLSSEARATIPDEGAQGLGAAVIKPLVEAGRMSVMVHEGYAIDVGTPERYLKASLDVLTSSAPPPPVTLTGEVIEVRGGLAYLGRGAIASAESLGPGAIVLAGATVPESVRLERAIVLPGAPITVDLKDAIWCDGVVEAGVH